MRDDLLQLLGQQTDVTNVVVATFNIDLLFIENLVLRALRRCGDPSLTIFADATEARRTFSAQRRWVGRIGRRDRVVPVAMETGFRFHPKAVLVDRPDAATLFVGSGNATFGGMRQNAEVWARYDTADGTGPFAAAHRFFSACAARAGDPDGVRRDLQEAFDSESHRWADGLAEPSDLFWRVASGPSLLDRLTDAINESDVSRITVACPFFDTETAALSEIASRWPQTQLRVLVQSRRSTLDRRAAEKLGVRLTLQSIDVANPSDQPAFFHAKFYAFESADRVRLFLGSANCSMAALGASGARGNAELLASIEMSRHEFDQMVCGELIFRDEPPVLADRPSEKPEPPASSATIITSASFDAGSLRVRFQAADGANVERLSCDEHEQEIESIDAASGRLSARLSAMVSRVKVAGQGPAGRFESPEHWVDQEFLLGATSRQRRVARAIESSVSSGTWGLAAWGEVLRLLGDHLQYTPKHSVLPGKRVPSSNAFEHQALRTEDFFASGYSLPRSHVDQPGPSDLKRLDGLRGLLLEYFGVDLTEPADESADVYEPESEDAPESVDHRERIRPRNEVTQPKARPREPTETERRRARRLAADVMERLTAPDFLQHRPASLLGTDLSIAATLMVAGFAEGWLDNEEYLQHTYKCWTALFFDDGHAAAHDRHQRGWIDRLHASAADPPSFAAAVAKPGLAAALIMWRQTCPPRIPPEMRMRFELASRVAVARVPWLWHLQNAEVVSHEIARIASATGWRHSGRGSLDQWLAAWEQVVHEGMALRAFEERLGQDAAGAWRGRIRDHTVPAHSLVWQGPLGFGVTGNSAACTRDSRQTIPLLLFRAERPETRIRADFLMPFRSLIDVAVPNLDGKNGGRAEIRACLHHLADLLEERHGPAA